LSATRRKPSDGSTHWSCRKLASALDVSKDAVHRVWQEAGLKPHRLEPYMASDDPEFEMKAADIIGLYLNPPQHAAVFCIDEKTAIQALDRLDPVLPLSPGRAERHGFEYYRHGTLSLYAALNTATGRVHGKTAARHTSREFVAFLHEVLSLCPPRQQIHIILDNLSAHKTPAVREFLQQHPRVQFHFTPTYSSWLNQVEIWFAKIEREVIARGIFTSVSDLARKLRRYINAYSANARPIRWKYSDPARRVPSNELTATRRQSVYASVLSCNDTVLRGSLRYGWLGKARHNRESASFVLFVLANLP
jgi:transposase